MTKEEIQRSGSYQAATRQYSDRDITQERLQTGKTQNGQAAKQPTQGKNREKGERAELSQKRKLGERYAQRCGKV